MESERLRAERRRIAIGWIGIIVSTLALVPSIGFAYREFVASGFWWYFSLLFSDREVVLAAWKELLMTLGESLPWFAVAACLATVFLLLGCLRFTFTHYEHRKHPHFAHL